MVILAIRQSICDSEYRYSLRSNRAIQRGVEHCFIKRSLNVLQLTCQNLRQTGNHRRRVVPVRVVSGMVNKMEIRRERLRDGAKLRVALAAQVVKIARLQRRAQIGLRGKEVACSIAASVAPLFRLRKATTTHAARHSAKRRPAADTSRQRPAQAARGENVPPGAVIAAPRLPRLCILQARMAAFNDQPAHACARLAGEVHCHPAAQ